MFIVSTSRHGTYIDVYHCMKSFISCMHYVHRSLDTRLIIQQNMLTIRVYPLIDWRIARLYLWRLFGRYIISSIFSQGLLWLLLASHQPSVSLFVLCWEAGGIAQKASSYSSNGKIIWLVITSYDPAPDNSIIGGREHCVSCAVTLGPTIIILLFPLIYYFPISLLI